MMTMRVSRLASRLPRRRISIMGAGAAAAGVSASLASVALAEDVGDNPFTGGEGSSSSGGVSSSAYDDAVELLRTTRAGESGPGAAASPSSARYDPEASPFSKPVHGAALKSVAPGTPQRTPQCSAGRNIVLGDQSIPEADRPHRVALCEWPADQAKHNGEPRTASARALFKWLNKNGYDGIEATVPYFASKFFPGMPLEQVALRAKKAAEAQGMKIFGANVWWCFDCGWEDGSIIHEMKEQVRLTKLMGGEYVSFQMWLKPDALGDGGAHRNDTVYLDEVARRIEKLHQLCFEQGMNCYIETHVMRVSEDPEAFTKIMDRCRVPFETNGDLSHYVYRGLRK